jgi:integrase
MTETNSTPTAAPAKPTKPYPEFPLTAHPAGYWSKKIRGKVYYFGKWSDPHAALEKYLEQKDALHAGRTPRPDPEALTVKALVNAFLNYKRERVDSGELKLRSWRDYKDSCDLVVAHLGKNQLVSDLRPADFVSLRKALAKRYGPVRLGNVIQQIRSVFKFAFDSELIAAPVRFGPGFDRPSHKTLRLHRAKQGLKLFSPEEIHRMLDAAPTPALKAMVLLGINCGFGNADVGRLPLSAVNLETGWIDYPRPKTGVQRRCPLWTETAAAIKEALAVRPKPTDPDAEGLVFVTRHGLSWSRDKDTGTFGILSAEMRKLLRRLGINGHRCFYTLRHTFRTVADEAKDQPACDHIMGHSDPSMAAHYRERISDDRLRSVSAYVRAWLFGEQVQA